MRYLTLSAAIVAAIATMSTPAAFAEGDHKIVDDKLELTIQMNHKRYPRYLEEWPVEQAARKMTNIHLKDATVGANSVSDSENNGKTEVLNLMLASGKIPDIVGSSRIKDFVNQYGPEGAFLPLNDLIDEHAPNLKAFFEKNPDVASALKAADGNSYYIPYLPDGKYGRAYFIRQDWLDKLKLKTPENVAELKTTLEAFRDMDPNGNGKKDEIPFFARQWPEVLRLVTLWDGRSSGSDTYHDFYVDEGKLKHPYAGEGYREGIKNIAQWYKEGLIDAEVFTRGSSSRDYLLGENLGGMTHDWFASTSGYNDSLADKVEGIQFKAFAPPASISGKRVEEHRRIPIKPDGWAIGHTNKHPVETIKYFDFWFSEEGRRLSNFGVEGEHYNMIDGKPTFTDAILNSDVPVNNFLYTIGAQLQGRGYHQDYRYEEQWSNKHALEGIALYDEGDYLIPQFLGVAFNAAEQKVYDRYWGSIRDYMLERQQAWILGGGDIEKDWANYQEQLEKKGYSKVIEVMQSAYARQYAKK